MTTDGRQDPRQPIGLEIRFKSATVDEFIERHSSDLSRGGLFVKTTSPMPSGTLLKFNVSLDEEGSLIQGVGRVVWRRVEDDDENAPAGMGIKFIKLDGVSQENLETILDSRVNDTMASVESPVLAKQSTGPSRLPRRIAPVRPQSVPKNAKSTMTGIGPDSPTLESIKPPKNELIEEEDALEEKEDRVDVSEQDSMDSSVQLEGEPIRESDTTHQDSAPPRETDILADISLAIDSALDRDSLSSGPTVEQSEDRNGSGDHNMYPVETENVSRPVGAGVSEDEVSGKLSTKQIIEDERHVVSRHPSPVVAARSGVQEEKRGVPGVVWFLLIFIVATLVWYFGFATRVGSPQSETQPSDTRRVSDGKPGIPIQAKDSEPETKKAEAVEQLMPKFTSLKIITAPAEAKIFVDGKEIEGVSPFSLEKIQVGKELEVKAQLFGYATTIERVVPSGKPVNMALEMQPAKLEVFVKSEPEKATLLIGKKRAGRTPYLAEKKTGFGPDFTYQINAPGFDDVDVSVTEKDWVEKDGVFRFNADVVMNETPKASKSTRSRRGSSDSKARSSSRKPKVVVQPELETETRPKVAAKPKAKPKPKVEEKPKAESKPKAEPKEPVEAIDDNPF